MPCLLAVTTTTRPGGVDYLTGTIARLEAAGASRLPSEQKLLYSDGGPPTIRPPGWTVVASRRAEGSRGAFWRVLELARGSDLLCLEDDVVVCRNAVTLMLDYQVPPELAFISFFDNSTPAGHPPGLEVVSAEGETANFIAAQALKVPARLIPHLLQPDSAVQLVVPRRPDGLKHGRDVVLYYYVQASAWPRWGQVFPHVVQHIGDVSVCNSQRAQAFAARGERRDSKNFAGTDFDALKLREVSNAQ